MLPCTALSTKVTLLPDNARTPPPTPVAPLTCPPVISSPSKVAETLFETWKARRLAPAKLPSVAASASPSALASMAMRPPPRMVSAWVIESWPRLPRWMVPARPGAKVTTSAPGLPLAMAIASRSEVTPSVASTRSARVVTKGIGTDCSSKAPISALTGPGSRSCRGWPRWSVPGAVPTAPSIAGLAASASSATVRVGPPLSASTPACTDWSSTVRVVVCAKTAPAVRPGSPPIRLPERVSEAPARVATSSFVLATARLPSTIEFRNVASTRVATPPPPSSPAATLPVMVLLVIWTVVPKTPPPLPPVELPATVLLVSVTGAPVPPAMPPPTTRESAALLPLIVLPVTVIERVPWAPPPAAPDPAVLLPLITLPVTSSASAETPPPCAKCPAVLLPLMVVPMSVSSESGPARTPPPRPASAKAVVRPPVMVIPSSVTSSPPAMSMARRALKPGSVPLATVAALPSPSALASMTIRPSPRMVRSCVIQSWPSAPSWIAPVRPAAKVTMSAPGLALA